MFAEDVLHDIEQMICGRATDAVKKRTVDGVSLEYYIIEELLILRDKFKYLAAAESGEAPQLPGQVFLEFRG